MLKAVLVGDSIRRRYQSFVAEKLAGKIRVVGPWENCRHSLWALDHYQQWVGDEMAEIVHVNFGLHDTAVQADGQPQIVLEQYKLCAGRFFAHGNDPLTSMVWATTTPRFFRDPDLPKGRWRKDPGVDAYNAEATALAREAGLQVNDLHAVIMDNGFDRCLGDDGVHMTDTGNEVLAEAVAAAILAAARARPGEHPELA